jgi:hypothetical protein
MCDKGCCGDGYPGFSIEFVDGVPDGPGGAGGGSREDDYSWGCMDGPMDIAHPCYFCHPDPCGCMNVAEGPGDEKTDRGTIDLINHGSYDFIDISSERHRTYDYIKVVDDEPVLIGLRIDNPQWLAISKTGHRILDADGDSHYVPFGWVHLWWRVRKGAPHFVK